MKIAYCYFSASGNGLEITQKLNAHIEGDVFELANMDIQILADYDRIIIITPLYSFGVALPTEIFIKKLGFLREKEFIVIFNYAGFTANAFATTQAMFKEQSLNLLNIYKVRMPLSFSTVAVMPSFMEQSILKKVPREIEAIASSIEKNETQIFQSGIFKGLDQVREKNKDGIGKMAKDFTVTDQCIRCEQCVRVCPMKNVSMEDDSITFADHCCGCLACYNRCPKHAIQYKGKKVKTYVNPNVKF